MIIEEEGLEAFADQASSDSGQFRGDPGPDDDDDPDYQVSFISPSLMTLFYLSDSCQCVFREASVHY